MCMRQKMLPQKRQTKKYSCLELRIYYTLCVRLFFPPPIIPPFRHPSHHSRHLTPSLSNQSQSNAFLLAIRLFLITLYSYCMLAHTLQHNTQKDIEYSVYSVYVSLFTTHSYVSGHAAQSRRTGERSRTQSIVMFSLNPSRYMMTAIQFSSVQLCSLCESSVIPFPFDSSYTSVYVQQLVQPSAASSRGEFECVSRCCSNTLHTQHSAGRIYYGHYICSCYTQNRKYFVHLWSFHTLFGIFLHIFFYVVITL